jgi:predicted enzyme related to lactoylglutathione lyase
LIPVGGFLQFEGGFILVVDLGRINLEDVLNRIVHDRDNLIAPYRQVNKQEEEDAHFAWREKDRPEAIGRTVWSIFPDDTDYFGPSRSPFMINYRVANLDRMLEQLRSGGVAVEKVEDYDYGRFAWITDPEGNRVELWEPKNK